MNGKRILSRLCCILLIMSLLPMGALAASKPSQAGERKLEGGQRDFAWPVPGQYNLSSCFLDNRSHYSLDIAAPMGVNIVASYAGKVIGTYTECEHNWGKKGSCCSSWGNYVLLEHNYKLKDGTYITLYSRYAHLSKVSVSVGQSVTKGQKIGTNGSTGNSTGPHLDYEILYGGTSPSKTYSVDPYINDLLELPEELHTTFGQCCQEYVAYVKTLYPRCVHEAYDSQGKCTACGYAFDWKTTRDVDAMGNYTVSVDTVAYAIPYDQAEDTKLTAGQSVAVNATVVNGTGKIWYELSLENGETAYAPEAALNFGSYFESQISLSNCTVKDSMVLPQESYRLDGKVTSKYPLRSITGYLDGAEYATWTGTGGVREITLRGTNLNKKLSFAALEPGVHTFSISVTDSTGRSAYEVYNITFTIEKDAVVYEVIFLHDGEQQILLLEEGQPLGELPDVTQEGMYFLGWYTEDDQEVTAETVPAGNMTLQPKWSELVTPEEPQEPDPIIPDEEIPVETTPTVPEIPEQETIPQETTPQEAEDDPWWWRIPVYSILVLGGIAGLIIIIQKKRSKEALF